MSDFAFSQVDPETSGFVTRIPTPIGDYLGAMYEQGQNDSAFNAVRQMREYSIEDGDDSSRMMSREEATKQYGIPRHLEFQEPTRESVAQLMQARKRAEMDRQFQIENGSSALRLLPGLAASFIGGVSNPLDMGLMFVPIVGEEAAAARVAEAGGGFLRQTLARGLIPMESIVKSGIPLPKFSAAVLQGTIGQAMFEVPTMLRAWQTNEEYTGKQFATDVLAGGAFAGALHAGIFAASRILRHLDPGTQAAMQRQGIEDFLNNKMSDLSDYSKIDENAIMQRVLMERDPIARAEAEAGVSVRDILEGMRKRYDEYPVRAAYLLNDGTVLSEGGEAGHPFINLPEDVRDPSFLNEAPLIEGQRHVVEHTDGKGEPYTGGFVTNKDRYVTRVEANDMLGREAGRELFSEHLASHMSDLGPEEESVYYAVMEDSGDKAKAIDAVRSMRQRQAEENFAKRPEIQELVERERQRQVEALLDKKRQEFDPKERFDQLYRQELGRMGGNAMDPREVAHNTHGEIPTSEDHAKLDEQIRNLSDEEKLHYVQTGELPAQGGAFQDAIDLVDKAIKALEVDPTKLHMDPFLLKTLGAPILRGALIVVREALRVGKSLSEAVDHAMEYLDKRYFNPPSGMNRRSFLDKIGKIAAAAGVAPHLKLAEALKDVPATTKFLAIVAKEGALSQNSYVGLFPLSKLKERLSSELSMFHETNLPDTSWSGTATEDREYARSWAKEFLDRHGIKLSTSQLRELSEKLYVEGEKRSGRFSSDFTDIIAHLKGEEHFSEQALAEVEVPNEFVEAWKKRRGMDDPSDPYPGGGPDEIDLFPTDRTEEGILNSIDKARLLSKSSLMDAMRQLLPTQSSLLSKLSSILEKHPEAVQKIEQAVERAKEAEKVEPPAEKVNPEVSEREQVRAALFKELSEDEHFQPPPEMDVQGWDSLTPEGKNRQLDRMNQLGEKLKELDAMNPRTEAVDAALDCILRRIA